MFPAIQIAVRGTRPASAPASGARLVRACSTDCAKVTLRIPDWQPQALLQPISFAWSQQAGVELAVLRMDLLDAQISGNKWFKLRPHLLQAQSRGALGLISLGGAHSNHLHALAAAGQRFGFATVGLLRGECQPTPTVLDLQAFGMQLHWLGYGGYRARHKADFVAHWEQRYPGYQLIPEGGAGQAGASGFASVPLMISTQLASLGWSDYDACWLAVGTGTSLAGLVLAEAGRHTVYGARVVPAGHGAETQVSQLLLQAGRADKGYRLLDACHGGYARVDPTLAAFVEEMDQDGRLPLEACYTAKALLALRYQVEAGYFAAGTRLIFIHTGGMQGRRAQQALLDSSRVRPLQ